MTAQTLNRFDWAKAVAKSELLPRAKLVAWSLAIDFCNEESGRLDPSLTTISEATGLTLDTVKRAIRDLTEGEWLGRTEGRGRGNKTAYTLLSPGKVIAISNTKDAARMHSTKECTGAPLTKQKGAQVHGKGGTGALSHNRAKQTMNKGAGVPNWYRTHHFAGNAFAGLVMVSSSNRDALYAWGNWLKAQGFPALDHFPIEQTGKKNGTSFFSLPWKTPPTDAGLIDEACEFFASMLGQGDAHAVNS